MRATGDTAGLSELITPDAMYRDEANNATYTGVGEFAAYVRSFHVWSSDLKLIHVAYAPEFQSAKYAVTEWHVRGTQDRAVPGLIPVATDRTFELQGMTIAHFRYGRIWKMEDYYDRFTFWQQLGAVVEFPGRTMN